MEEFTATASDATVTGAAATADRRARALELHRQGALVEAATLYRCILDAAPDDGQTWHYLAVLHGQQDRPADVLRCCAEALRCGHVTAAVHANAGLAHRALGDDAAALAAFQAALELDPDDAELTLEYTQLLIASGAEREALDRLAAACERFPADARFHTELGRLAADLNDGERAERAFRQAVRLDEQSSEAWLNLGSILQMRGRRSEAEAACRQALVLDPESDHAYWYLAQLVTPQQDPALAAAIIARAERAGGSASAPIRFAAGKMQHESGHTGPAFTAYAAGNRRVRGTYDYRVGDAIAAIDRLQLSVQRDDWAPPLAATAEPGEPAPIFIVGMPRSGSTLIEHMLARHPAIDAGGEIVWLQRHLRAALRRAQLQYPADQRSLSDDQLAIVRQRYGAALQARHQGGAFLTDKLPANFLCIPSIRRLFPASLIIHARRDPVETGWSCFRHLFSGGQHFAYDLDEVGRYAAAVHRFVDTCRARWPHAVVDVSLEALISNRERVIRGLLQRLQLEWDPRCLAPEDTGQLIQTASALQVRQRIAPADRAGAMRYDEYLGPLREALRAAGVDLAQNR